MLSATIIILPLAALVAVDDLDPADREASDAPVRRSPPRIITQLSYR